MIGRGIDREHVRTRPQIDITRDRRIVRNCDRVDIGSAGDRARKIGVTTDVELIGSVS